MSPLAPIVREGGGLLLGREEQPISHHQTQTINCALIVLKDESISPRGITNKIEYAIHM